MRKRAYMKHVHDISVRTSPGQREPEPTHLSRRVLSYKALSIVTGVPFVVQSQTLDMRVRRNSRLALARSRGRVVGDVGHTERMCRRQRTGEGRRRDELVWTRECVEGNFAHSR